MFTELIKVSMTNFSARVAMSFHWSFFWCFARLLNIYSPAVSAMVQKHGIKQTLIKLQWKHLIIYRDIWNINVLFTDIFGLALFLTCVLALVYFKWTHSFTIAMPFFVWPTDVNSVFSPHGSAIFFKKCFHVIYPLFGFQYFNRPQLAMLIFCR